MVGFVEDRLHPDCRVYFATAKARPGEIKIGTSSHLEWRMQYGNMKLIVSIPGFTGREAALLWAMRDLRVDGEWFRSEPKLWRAIIEALDTGDISWLPPEFETGWELMPGRRRAILAHYGSAKGAASALSCSPGTVSSSPGAVVWARFLMERALAEPALAEAA